MISIIILAFEKLGLLINTLEKIKLNTKVEHEIIIIDNSNKDSSTRKFIKTLQNKENYKIILNEINSGFAKGVNQGIKIAKGDYICLLNDDTEVSENWLTLMLKHFETKDRRGKKRKVGAVAPMSDVVMGWQKISAYKDFDDEHDVPFLIGLCLLIPKKVLDKIGLLDEQFFFGEEDLDWSMRATDKGYKLIIAQDVFVRHFGGVSVDKKQYDKYFPAQRKKLLLKWGEERVNETTRYRPLVTIALPYHQVSYVKFEHFRDALQTPFACKNIRTYQTPIDIARHQLAGFSMQLGSKYHFFVDTDMRLRPETIIRLMSHKKDVCSAYAYSRQIPYTPTTMKWNKKKLAFEWRDYANQGLKRVDGVGVFCCLIRTEIFYKFSPKEFPFEPSIKRREDLGFCLKLMEKGVKIHCDTDFEIKHIGDRQEIGRQQYLAYIEFEKMLKEKQGGLIVPKGKIIKPELVKK